MRAANFTTLFIGIESPRRESLAETKKTQNLRGDLVENVQRIQSYGIQVQAGMIVGFDHDDASIFEEQLRFIQEARIGPMTVMLQAIPQTPLYDAWSARACSRTTGDQVVLRHRSPVITRRRSTRDRCSPSSSTTSGTIARAARFLCTAAGRFHGGATCARRPAAPRCVLPHRVRGGPRRPGSRSPAGRQLLRPRLQEAVSFASSTGVSTSTCASSRAARAALQDLEPAGGGPEPLP